VKLAAAVLLVACHHDAPPPPPPASAPAAAHQEPLDELEHDFDAVVVAFDELSKTIADAHGDCPSIAAALRKFGADHAAELPKLAELMKRLAPEEQEKFKFDHEEEGKRITKPVELAFGACPADRDVAAAVKVAGFERTK
jgi:hypothetical protein